LSFEFGERALGDLRKEDQHDPFHAAANVHHRSDDQRQIVRGRIHDETEEQGPHHGFPVEAVLEAVDIRRLHHIAIFF